MFTSHGARRRSSPPPRPPVPPVPPSPGQVRSDSNIWGGGQPGGQRTSSDLATTFATSTPLLLDRRLLLTGWPSKEPGLMWLGLTLDSRREGGRWLLADNRIFVIRRHKRKWIKSSLAFKLILDPNKAKSVLLLSIASILLQWQPDSSG